MFYFFLSFNPKFITNVPISASGSAMHHAAINTLTASYLASSPPEDCFVEVLYYYIPIDEECQSLKTAGAIP